MFLEDAVESTSEVTFTQFDKIFQFDFIKNIDNVQIQLIIIKAFELVAILIAVFILFKLIDLITRRHKKIMEKKKIDKTVTNSFYNIANKGLKILVILIAIGCLGIDTSSIVGLLTAAGLGVGLAIQGALSNFAGGFLILANRPFSVDDYIEGQGVSGTVLDINLFYTYLKTPDNKKVMIPNGTLIGGNIINYSQQPTRRVELKFAIDYDENIEKSKKIIKDTCIAHDLVLKDPEPFVRVCEFADSSINIVTRVWVKNGDYWTVYFDLLEQVYINLVANNVKIPYNQLEISYRPVVENVSIKEEK